MKNVELKLFTVADLRQWLIHNHSVEGLTNEVIAPTRAFAILNNPYVHDDDTVVSTVYENGNLAAYTAAFPELNKGKRIWWFTTLFCKPEFVGKGYGLIVVGSLAELYGEGNFFDLEGAGETVEIFKYLGLKTTFVPKYEFGPGKIQRGSLKGELAFIFQCLKLRFHSDRKSLKKDAKKSCYSIEYSQHVDDEAYSFVMKNCKNDAFVREQKMLNWIIAYPFLQDSPLTNRVENDCFFSSSIPLLKILAVKVRVDKELIGFYILKLVDNGIFVKYLYYEERYSNVVFLSIAEHLLQFDNPVFSTRNKDLASFIQNYKLTSKFRESNSSFSYPATFELKEDSTCQSGDGDNFV